MKVSGCSSLEESQLQSLIKKCRLVTHKRIWTYQVQIHQKVERSPVILCYVQSRQNIQHLQKIASIDQSKELEIIFLQQLQEILQYYKNYLSNGKLFTAILFQLAPSNGPDIVRIIQLVRVLEQKLQIPKTYFGGLIENNQQITFKITQFFASTLNLPLEDLQVQQLHQGIEFTNNSQ